MARDDAVASARGFAATGKGDGGPVLLGTVINQRATPPVRNPDHTNCLISDTNNRTAQDRHSPYRHF